MGKDIWTHSGAFLINKCDFCTGYKGDGWKNEFVAFVPQKFEIFDYAYANEDTDQRFQDQGISYLRHTLLHQNPSPVQKIALDTITESNIDTIDLSKVNLYDLIPKGETLSYFFEAFENAIPRFGESELTLAQTFHLSSQGEIPIDTYLNYRLDRSDNDNDDGDDGDEDDDDDDDDDAKLCSDVAKFRFDDVPQLTADVYTKLSQAREEE